MNNSGQNLSIDLFFAVIVILFVVVNLLGVFQTNTISSQKEFEIISSENLALTKLNELVLTPGIPNNWQSISLADVNSIGLVSQTRIIDKSKLSAVDLIPYETLKQKLHTNDFFLTIDRNSVRLFQKGLEYKNSSSASFSRVVEYDGNIAIISLTLYSGVD